MKQLIEYGIEVFNGEEEKFQRWFNKYNSSIQGVPFEFCKTAEGTETVRKCLNRIEYGNY